MKDVHCSHYNVLFFAFYYYYWLLEYDNNFFYILTVFFASDYCIVLEVLLFGKVIEDSQEVLNAY